MRITPNYKFDNVGFEDRALNTWLYNPNGGFAFVASRIDDYNYHQYTYEEWDDISEWFWIYMGYSHIQ